MTTNLIAWQQPEDQDGRIKFGMSNGNVYAGKLTKKSNEDRWTIPYDPNKPIGLWKLSGHVTSGQREIEITYLSGEVELVNNHTVSDQHAFTVGSRQNSGEARFGVLKTAPA